MPPARDAPWHGVQEAASRRYVSPWDVVQPDGCLPEASTVTVLSLALLQPHSIMDASSNNFSLIKGTFISYPLSMAADALFVVDPAVTAIAACRIYLPLDPVPGHVITAVDKIAIGSIA